MENETIIISEVTSEAFEKRLLEIQRNKQIVDVRFESLEAVFFAMITYKKTNYNISELPKLKK